MIAYFLVPQVSPCRGIQRIFGIVGGACRILCWEVITVLTNLSSLLSMNDEHCINVFSLDSTTAIFNVFKFYCK